MIHRNAVHSAHLFSTTASMACAAGLWNTPLHNMREMRVEVKGLHSPALSCPQAVTCRCATGPMLFNNRNCVLIFLLEIAGNQAIYWCAVHRGLVTPSPNHDHHHDCLVYAGPRHSFCCLLECVRYRSTGYHPTTTHPHPSVCDFHLFGCGLMSVLSRPSIEKK
jgi:hypothetical protein